MNTNVPFVKQETVWLAIIPRLIFIGLLSLLFFQFDQRNYFIYAFITYLIITYAVKRMLFTADVYRSIALIKQERFEEAIPLIKNSIVYYSKNAWIDKYRFLLMISSSRRSIREVSICNLGYCLLQSGKTKEAKEIYESVLTEYPGNIVALSALKTINAITDNPIV